MDAPVISENAEASVIKLCASHQSTERLAFQITGSTRYYGEKGNAEHWSELKGQREETG